MIKEIAEAARRAGSRLELVRHGGRHDLYRCGTTAITMPRHVEINDRTAAAIRSDLEQELGERWWR